MDLSNGYEGVAVDFLKHRGNPRTRSAGIGVRQVRDLAATLPRGAAVIDVGCGSGLPLTEVLVAAGLDVYGVDASPSLVAAFRRNLPNTPVACEAVETSSFFNRSFDAVLCWGLMFLLSPETQRLLLQQFSRILVPGGRLLFTSPREPVEWNDAMTGLPSRSLGAEEYRNQLAAARVSVTGEYEDEGQNHYFEARKARL